MKIFLAFIAVAFSLSAHGKSSPYWIKVNSSANGRSTVIVDIQTNLPDTSTLSVSLSLVGQKPDDVFIGTDFERLSVKAGRAKILVDGSKRVFPRDSRLPAGKYNVDVDYYPAWTENRVLASKLRIGETLKATDQVFLGGSGATVSTVKKKAEGQRWVMVNVTMGMEWDASAWIKRFGNYEELPLAAGYGNPRILKMFYFPSIDMTLMVNVLKGEIGVWRMGKQYN